MSCMLGVSPRPLTSSPFSVSAVCLVMLLLALFSSVRFLAMTVPLAFCQGPDGTDQAPRHEGYDGARAPRKLRTRRPALIVEHDDLGKRRDASASCMYGG